MSQKGNKTFLYKQVYQDLKDRIHGGEYLLNALLPSEREIGEYYHVDRTTVRKALQMLVDEELVEKRPGKGTLVVWRPEPSQAAVQAQSGHFPEKKGTSIAFFLPKDSNGISRITQPFYSQLFYEAQQECQRHGYTLIYSTLDESDSLEEVIGRNAYAGIFFLSNVARRHLEDALERKIPSVLINSYYERMPSILSDNFTGTYEACRYLIRLGHTSIGILNGDRRYITNKERFRGCAAAMAEAGLDLKDEFNLGGGSWSFEAGLGAVEQMLNTTDTRPSAIIAFNDRLALGAIQAIHGAGLRVPDHISVVGYDYSDQAKYSLPKITSVEAHLPLMARAAVRLLFQQIEHYETLPVKVLIPVKLMEADSTAPWNGTC